MKKKIASILIIMLSISAVIASHLISYAKVAETPIYVNMTATDINGIGYGAGNPNPTGGTSNKGEYIWNITSHKSLTGPVSEKQRDLYCVQAGYGQEWFNNGNVEKILEYNLSFDIQADRESLLSKVQDNQNTADEVIRSLLDPAGNTYRQLLWLFDNAYIKGQTNINDYLEQIGIFSDVYEGRTYYYKVVGDTEIDYPSGDPLTESDIIAIQRMAVWTITDGGDYDKTDEDIWLFITSNGTDYESLKVVSESRHAMAMDLYNYLVTGARNGANQYTEQNGYKIGTVPPNVDTTNLKQENTKYVLETKKVEGNYVIGPIKINENNASGSKIEIIVSDQNNKPLAKDTQYIFTDKDGKKLNITTTKDLAGIAGGFFISVPTNLVENINVKVNISYNERLKQLWLPGTEDANSIKLIAEQPLMEVLQSPKTITVDLISKPQEFDLALRKYITAVNGNNLTTTRVPVIDESTISTEKTATYKHKKDPVIVKDKDEVTYKITIYNEGSKTGYAKKIIDQLPTGLVSSTKNLLEVVSKGPDGAERNKYHLDYYPSNNQIVLTLIQSSNQKAKDLQQYVAGKLDYETIEIKCMVAQEADETKPITLTNVAWIAEAYDSQSQKEISAQGTQDRDSKPQTAPNLNKETTDYKGNALNKDVLSDSGYFYKGQEDDDDFEKLVIMPVEKVFDLALFKHIAAVSKEQKIENGEYITDTGNKDGKYLRAPEVTAIDPDTGKITYKQDDKTALTIEPGSYVLYTIRVYNEGEVNGYASKIKDTLPIGLTFVTKNEEYNGIWKLEGLDADGRQVVSTTWYAKGQGAELNAEQSDPNYQANLLKAVNKEGKISDENPDYIDAQVLCQVTESANSDRVLVNYAQVADDSDENGDPIDDIDSTPDKWVDGEDDQDIERVQLQYFDLSLRKFITAVNGTQLKNREPVVDVSNLVNKNGTTATYTHPKEPVPVKRGDKVVYTIRVYNEGNLKGSASEITDYLPPYLTFVKESEINTKYGWKLSENGRKVTTAYLENTELKAFNGTKLDYADVKIECIVSEKAPLKENQTNIAEISEYTYNGGTAEKDVDSTANNVKVPADKELPTYKDSEINKPYVPGNEDDDDFEKIYVREFDLALRKFITKVQNTDVTTRIPQVKIEKETISYEHSKDALTVHVGDVVIYTLRIYNEGEIDGYATEIADDIPEYLEYLPEDSTNVEYMWKMYNANGEETEKIEEAVKIKTKYLSKENGKDNLIKAFDGKTVSYEDIKIAFKVKDPNSNTQIITNHAQITDDADENGDPVNDKDSKPNEWNEGEDDQDIENIKVEYFDLSLLKFVRKVIVQEEGKETITETGYNGHENPEPVVKVELHKKKLDKVVVKFVYGITITNEGDVPGYATEIIDYIPQGLKFVATDNPDWTDEGNNVISTKQLQNTLLQPGQSETIEVMFTWINGKDNLALKTNVAEISDDDNQYDVPDRDSTPDNKKDGEDDIDEAKVILAITTGSAQTYFTLTLGLLTIILVGVVLIKKFVI